jgi:hypothetical protein
VKPSSRCMVFVSLCSVVLAAACRAPQPERGEVQREWNHTLRELGIQPVYPPREDLAVGDVYVRRGRVDDQELVPTSGFAPLDLWLASAAPGASLDAFYGARASYPATPADPAAASPATAIHQVGDATRLRTVAFPDFASVNVRAVDARAFIPLEAIGLGLGGNWNGQHQVNVKVPLAESCGLPLNLALPLVAERNGDAWFLRAAVADPVVLTKLHADVKAWAATAAALDEAQRKRITDDPNLHLDLVTEVFYTRAIDVAVSSQTSSGGRASARPVAVPGAAGEAPLLAPEGDAVARARQLNDELQEVDALGAPGGSLQFLSASDQGLSMRRTFERPIAIGYRAVQITVNPVTGEIAGFGAASERVAVVTGGTDTELMKALETEIGALMSAEQRRAFQILQTQVAGQLRFVFRSVSAEEEGGALGALEATVKRAAPEIAARVGAQRDWDPSARVVLAQFGASQFTFELADDE